MICDCDEGHSFNDTSHQSHDHEHAESGWNGLLDPVEPGLACGSDTAHMSLFGYDPRVFYRGRGAFESMGAGMEMEPGDIAFKSNFAVLDEESGVVLHRRADRNFEEEGPQLCEAMNGTPVPGFENYTILVRYATEHRCGVVIRGPRLSDRITGTDPLKDNLPLIRAEALDQECHDAVKTAAIVNAASDCMREILKKHPINEQRRKLGKNEANVVLLRGCASRLALENFDDKYGTKSCMIAPTKIIAGMGMCLGMKIIDVHGGTGDYHTKLDRKANAMAQAMIHEEYDFGFLHVKAVDDAGHDKRLDLKIDFIELVDTMIGQLVRMLYNAGEDAVIAVTGDHSTPVEFGDHSFEPVPFAMSTVNAICDMLGGDEGLSVLPQGDLFHPCLSSHTEAQDRICEQKIDNYKAELKRFVHNGSPKNDTAARFSENEAAKGVLGRFPGSSVLGIMQSLANSPIHHSHKI